MYSACSTVWVQMLESCNNLFCAIFHLVAPAEWACTDFCQAKYPYNNYSLFLLKVFHSFYFSYSSAPRELLSDVLLCEMCKFVYKLAPC